MCYAIYNSSYCSSFKEIKDIVPVCKERQTSKGGSPPSPPLNQAYNSDHATYSYILGNCATSIICFSQTALLYSLFYHKYVLRFSLFPQASPLVQILCHVSSYTDHLLLTEQSKHDGQGLGMLFEFVRYTCIRKTF